MPKDAVPPRRIRVWDWPTRAFHWLLVILLPLQWWTGHEEMMELHIATGQVLLGLLLFRLIWGLAGSETARFARFLKGPAAVLGYLRGRAGGTIGHNPLGGWSVAAMLLLLATQIGLGLLASDEDGLYAGPLAHLVSFDAAIEIAEMHELVFKLLAGLVGLHLFAIAYYALVRRTDLVTPMVTGAQAAESGVEGIAPAGPARVAIAAALAAGMALLIVKAI
ncbi:MAG: cytochrome b/b6 domain-containing protein [Alphaproteobacteria bacterium]